MCVQAWFVNVCSADPAPSPPVRDIGLFNCGSPCPPYSDLDDSHSAANGVTLTALHDCGFTRAQFGSNVPVGALLHSQLTSAKRE